MARLESTASGGYFPSPQHLIPLIAAHLTPAGGAFVTADPCAGDGEAVLGLVELCGRGRVYTCEMEAQRHAGLVERLKGDWQSRQSALHGDAFRVHTPSGGVGLLFLNPPYDLDAVHGRLEQRFLDRFTPALTEGGVLVFLVPYYALAASAQTLATEFDDVSCFRFPDEDFAAFKQVVLFAKKCDQRLAPDAAILSLVSGWATSAAEMPVLGTVTEEIEIPSSYSSTWRLQEVDIKGLVKKARPWRETRAKGTTGALTFVAHTVPEMPVEDLLFRTFPIATAPRPAHIAAGIASGLFNGRQVESETTGMPNLLVKGVFDREYVTIEEKTNKDGIITSVVQVQQPKLVTTVLDLETKKYSTLKLAGQGKPGATTVDEMSIEGLLTHYGPSLMRVMNLQCPVTYDPARDSARLPLATINRPLYTAQENAAKALLSLLGGPGISRSQRRGKASILLGEIGSGKSATVLSVGRTIANRMLVLCPPHLLTSWTNECRSVLPEAEIRVLANVEDVDQLVDVPSDKFLVAILSRETAKLGHGWSDVSGPGCPKCGAALPAGDLAKKRVCCPATALSLGDDLARDAFDLARHLAPVVPASGAVGALLDNRHQSRWLARLEAEETKAEWPGFDSEWVTLTLAHTIQKIMTANSENALKLLGRLVLADYQPECIASLARTFASRVDYQSEEIARELTMLLPTGKLQDEVKAITFAKSSHATFEGWTQWINRGMQGKLGTIQRVDGVLTLDGHAPGSVELALAVLSKLGVVGRFSRAEECGEPLFQAIPEPVRYPLAKYISRRHPGLFDFLVLDEGHEYSSDSSAQSFAAHRLTALGIPTVLMTGSVMNGYAESLFTNLWALSADFRAEFSRDERQRYIDRYGYRKRILTDKDKETGEVVKFGAVTDRVERSSRVAGDAPGILPLFLFRHLLKFSVTLHKADLALDLPACRQIKQTVEASPKLLKNFNTLQRALIAQIRKDQFTPEYAGKLFGALAELPSYLDRSTDDTGNQDDGSYEIRYPASLGSGLVVRVEPLPASTLSPKEEWMIERVRAELAEGRNVMVFGWHVSLLPRLSRILEKALGEKAPILYADKVPTSKRQDWIQKNIVNKGVRIMVANPVCIQTGLNNLVHFCTEIWFENPACNPIIFRQAIGRVDRIGQKKETRIYVPIYSGTLQVPLHDLLMRKVAVSIATDGLDNESALLAAGASDDAQLTGMSIGRQLWALLSAN